MTEGYLDFARKLQPITGGLADAQAHVVFVPIFSKKGMRPKYRVSLDSGRGNYPFLEAVYNRFSLFPVPENSRYCLPSITFDSQGLMESDEAANVIASFLENEVACGNKIKYGFLRSVPKYFFDVRSVLPGGVDNFICAVLLEGDKLTSNHKALTYREMNKEKNEGLVGFGVYAAVSYVTYWLDIFELTYNPPGYHYKDRGWDRIFCESNFDVTC